MEKHREPPGDVRKSGYLRKQKSLHRRFFVLRAGSARGPARLEYYDSEKKFRGKAPVPRKALVLESVFNVNKRADAKHKHMIALYTRTESFLLAAEGETEQDEWYRALLELHCQSKVSSEGGGGGDYGLPSPGPAFKEVWQVKVWPKGLGQARNLVGVYRLCLTERTVIFVKLHSDAAAVVLQLMNVRRCGHSENFFFVEVGRSAITGAGEFWMQVEDCVVAQNMHETLLDAMKGLSEEFRQPGGGATASNPISVPSRRHHPNPPPSQVGFSRRPRTEPPVGGSPSCRHSFPEGTAAASSSPTPSDTAAKAPPALTRSTSTPAPGSERWTGGVCPLSGSLSDCGSSDECGSSPSSLADDASNYILMGQSGTTGHALRRPSGQRASLSPAAALRCGSGEEAGEESSYAVMSRTRAERHSAGHGGGAYLDVADETLDPPAHATGASVTRDNGYMCMLPGVTAPPAPPSDSDSRLADDYMSMIPSGSVSPPRQVGDGYMMMSPSSSVSPEQRATPSPWCGGSSAGSDYMNMSPVSARSTSSSSPPPLVPAGRRPLQAPPKTLHSYYSLPRSYKHRAWACVEAVGGGSSLSSSSSSSSSTSSESLGDEQTGGVRRRRSSVKRRHSTLPRAKSPGEYVSIQPRPSPPCGDYTSMTFSLDSGPASPSATPAGPSSVSGPPLEFSPAEAPRPDAHRVVRAELPGRRRPCSETFRVWLGPSALADHTRRPSQEGVARLAPPLPQQGLNYIDLDLASKESSRATGDVLPAAHTSATQTPPPSSSCSSPSAAATGASGGASSLNPYASIDFYRSEELRTQHTNTSSTGKKEARVAVEHHEEC